MPVTPSHGVGALYAPRRTVRDPILVDAALRASATPARIGRGSLAVLRELVAATAPELTGRLAAARPPTVVRAFPGVLATSGRRGGQAGRSSATPPTTKARWARMV